jgi:hypothetical protein
MKPTIAILGTKKYPINKYLVSKLINSYNIHIIGTKPKLSTKIKLLIKVFKQNGLFGTFYYLLEKYKENYFLDQLVRYENIYTDNRCPTFLFKENSQELIKHFVDNQYNFIILVKSGIISSDLLTAANCKLVNVHPAKLPEYRGYAEPAHAINDGRLDLIGSTIHWVDEGIDSGSIIEWQPYLNAESKDLSLLLAEVRFNGFAKLVDLMKKTDFAALVGEPQQVKFPLYKMLDWQNRKLTNIKFKNLN